MLHATAFIKRHGEPCTIIRDPPVSTFVTMKRSSSSAVDPAAREAHWEGLILGASGLTGGETFQVGANTFLVHTATPDPSTGEIQWFGAKTNALVDHQRYSRTADRENGRITQTWSTLHAGVSVFFRVVTAELRQEDPGLVDTTRFIMQAPMFLGVVKLDRFILGGNAYQVESIDDVGLPGIVRVQLGVDLRL